MSHYEQKYKPTQIGMEKIRIQLNLRVLNWRIQYLSRDAPHELFARHFSFRAIYACALELNSSYMEALLHRNISYDDKGSLTRLQFYLLEEYFDSCLQNMA